MANYLEHLASPSANNVAIPAFTPDSADWTFIVNFRIPAGVTGDTHIIGRAAGSNNRWTVNPTSGVSFFRINGVTATTPTLGIVAGTNYELDWRRIGSQMQVRLNGVLLHTFYYVLNFVDALDVLCGGAGTRSRIDLYRMRFISATINRDWSADGVTSGTVFPELIAGSNGTLTNFAGNPWKAEATINTIDNPIIPGEVIADFTVTGFSDGAATLSTPVIGGGTISAAATIAAGTDPKAGSVTYPDPVSESVYPMMGQSHVHTLTQGGISATIGSVVAQPDGYSLVTLNFPVTGNPNYVTGQFIVPPVTGDIAICSNPDVTIDPSGFWTAPGSTTAIVGHQVASTGAIYGYTFTFNEDGVVPGDSGGLSASGLTAVGPTSAGLSAVGL